MYVQSDYLNAHIYIYINALYQYMWALDMCYSLNVKTVLMCVYILCVCLFSHKRTKPVHVCAGHVCTLLSIKMVL